MVTFLPSRRDRYLYLGGSVDTARTRARLVAFLATLAYAACLFGLVLLAHEWMDGAGSASQAPPAAALHSGSHRL